MVERRANTRLKEEDRVAVTILRAADIPEIEGATFFCSTEDISVNGLRLSMHRRLPVGAELRLLVAFSEPLQAFTHVGKVLWVQASDGNPTFAVGVRLWAKDELQFENWRDMVTDKLSSLPPGEDRVSI